MLIMDHPEHTLNARILLTDGMTRRVFFLGIALSGVTMSLVNTQSVSVLGQDVLGPQSEYRIDTDIYSDENKPPIHTTQTMFLGTRTIEWDDTHRRLILVDYQDQSVTLADLSAQRKCRFQMQQLDERFNKLRSELTSQETATWTSPSPARIGDDGYYELACERSIYRFKTKSPQAESMAIGYADFADWSVKMHAVNPPYKPPLLRLQLNSFLRDQRVLPLEIRLTDTRSGNSKPIVARLIVQDQLTTQDLDRIRDWEVLTSTLKDVSQVEYFRQASAGPTSRAVRK